MAFLSLTKDIIYQAILWR